MEILLSQAFEQNGNVAYSFYREGIGFGQIESQSLGERGGQVALVTFSDGEDLSKQYLHDISIENGWRDAKPVADIEAAEDAKRFVALGINSALSARRDAVAAGYGDRLRKPRIQRALARRLNDPRYTSSPVKIPLD